MPNIDANPLSVRWLKVFAAWTEQLVDPLIPLRDRITVDGEIAELLTGGIGRPLIRLEVGLITLIGEALLPADDAWRLWRATPEAGRLPEPSISAYGLRPDEDLGFNEVDLLDPNRPWCPDLTPAVITALAWANEGRLLEEIWPLAERHASEPTSVSIQIQAHRILDAAVRALLARVRLAHPAPDLRVVLDLAVDLLTHGMDPSAT